MLTSSLGSLVDGLVIGNTMKTNAVAAFGLINPLNFIFAIIGSVPDRGRQRDGSFVLSADRGTVLRQRDGSQWHLVKPRRAENTRS